MRARPFAAQLLAMAALALATAGPRALLAAPPSAAELAAAKKLFELGLKLYHEGSYREALAAFLRANETSPRASIQRNIAQCHRDLKEFAEAYDAYQVLLTRYGATLPPADRKPVERAIEELALLTGSLKVAVADAGATVTIDGREVGKTPLPAAVRLNVGPHTATVDKPGLEPVRKDFSLRGGDEVKIEGPLQAEVTTGHLVVRAGEGVHVIVDGADVGVAPWEGDLKPGVHTVEGKGGDLVIPAHRVDVVRRERAEITLELATSTGRVQIDTHVAGASITLDDKPVGTGAWEGTLPPGPHRLRLEAPGYRAYEQTLFVHAGETVVEDRALDAAQRYDGVYSGLAVFGAAVPTGSNTFLAQACPSPPCQVSTPLGGGLAVRVGYAFGWWALEGMALGSYDQTTGNVTYASGVARTEDYTFHRFGGGGAIGARVASLNPNLRFTASALFGAVAMGNIYKQSARAPEASGGATAQNTSSTTTYTAPMLALDAGVLFGWPGGAKVHAGVLTLVHFVSGEVDAPSLGATSLGAAGSYATPALRVAGGTDLFIGPVIGFDLGL